MKSFWHLCHAPMRGFLAGVFSISLSACMFADPEREEDEAITPGVADLIRVAPEIVEPEPAQSAMEPSPPAPAEPTITPIPPNQDTPSCPERMIEIRGRYCDNLMHRCVAGGKTHLGEATQEPVPFYCDKYQVGFARCLGKEAEKHFCIDEYEYPNEQGTIPVVMVSWYEASQLCTAQNKRLCGDDEWTLACEGRERLPYPYGWERDATACNIDHPWQKPNDNLLLGKGTNREAVQAEVERLSRRVPSGSMPGCVSPYGVMDMGGNVDEWAVNVTLGGKPFRSVFKGGHWVKGARNRCRPVTASHDETTIYYAEGFRCCADLPSPAPSAGAGAAR